ncbi:alpha/beta fold hydrolase [Streptomyces mirabilis]|uniref:alpha/beta fold hydrolase n=1 Tax=Streptomyces mirabilis TaxID=68239 RepID=UPI003711A332
MRVQDGALALREAGHEVYTPGLPGIGERTHLTSPQVDLTTHVTDVADTILYEDLSDIVLLGYSYGDMVVTGALEHVADHVTLLVYLDAFLPRDGDSLNDLARASYSRGLAGPGAEWLAPPPGRSFDNPGEAAWQGVRRVPHPARCFSKPVWLRKPLEDYSFTRTYIKALDEPRPAPGAPPRTSTIMSRSGLSSPRTRCSSVVPKPARCRLRASTGSER